MKRTTTSLDCPLGFEVFQNAFQADAVGALEAEGAGDLAFADPAGKRETGGLGDCALARDEGEDLVTRGKRRGAGVWLLVAGI